MKKIKKYAYGTSVKNYIENPGTELQQQEINNAKALYEANTNPFTLGMQGIGNLLMQQGQQGLQQQASEGDESSANLAALGSLMPMLSNFKMAFGGQVPGVPVEVEGGEVAQTPNGDMMEFKGPNHEQGGVQTNLPEDTEVYSKRIKLDGKTLAQRKKSREKQRSKLAKMLDKNPTDTVLKNTVKRSEDSLAVEEAKDKRVQDSVNQIMQTGNPQTMAYGGTAGGGPGIDPEQLMKFLNQVQTSQKSPGQMAFENSGFDYTAPGMNNTVGMYKGVNTGTDGVDIEPTPINPGQSGKSSTGNNITTTGINNEELPVIDAGPGGSPINNGGGQPLIDPMQTIEQSPKGYSSNLMDNSNINQEPPITNDLGPGGNNLTLGQLNQTLKNNTGNLADPFTPSGNVVLNNGTPTSPGTNTTTTTSTSQSSQGTGSGMTFGDAVGLAGQLTSTFSPYFNTLLNRSRDTPNINPYLHFGEKGLEKLDDTKRYVAQQRDENLKDLELARRSAIQRGRNSARSVNVLRGLDLATQQSVNNQQSNIYNQFANQMAGIMGREAQALDRRDQMVMQGEAARDLADRQDTDNFYTQRRVDLENIGFGTQNIGKSLNQIYKRGQNEEMINELKKLFKNETAYNQFMQQFIRNQKQIMGNNSQTSVDKSVATGNSAG